MKSYLVHVKVRHRLNGTQFAETFNLKPVEGPDGFNGYGVYDDEDKMVFHHDLLSEELTVDEAKGLAYFVCQQRNFPIWEHNHLYLVASICKEI